MKEAFISINQQQIFTRLYNENYDFAKPTIVFLHEALGSVAQWRNYPKQIAEKTGFNAVAYDRLGHGLSDLMMYKRDINYLHHEAWEVLPAVLAHLGIKCPVLFGHSDGGSIALLYASRFETLALLTEAAHVFVEDITLTGIREAVTRKDFLTERLAAFHGEKTVNLFTSWSDTWLDKDFKDWNIEANLKNIACPALIMQGDKDEYGTGEQVTRITKGIGKQAQKLTVDNCGHTPHKESPDKIEHHIINFLSNHV